jgi:hypothetical protein
MVCWLQLRAVAGVYDIFVVEQQAPVSSAGAECSCWLGVVWLWLHGVLMN